jgi:beta-lactam-binding protein with PASTA domain
VAKLINMPNVVGMPAADAKVILDGAGFTSIKFVDEANPNAELSIIVSYTVTKQSVAAGTQVPADTAIVITGRTTSNGKG